MIGVADIFTVITVSAGAFFMAGSVGLLRFPDTLTRLHALTKADNLGLGGLKRTPMIRRQAKRKELYKLIGRETAQSGWG